MKTIFFCILIVVNLASALGANFTGFTLQSASLKRFGLQGDFVSIGRCEEVFFDLGRIEQLHFAESEEIKQISMPLMSFSRRQLNSVQLNFNPNLGAEQAKDFGIDWLIIGHSERRQIFGESNETVHKKV